MADVERASWEAKEPNEATLAHEGHRVGLEDLLSSAPLGKNTERSEFKVRMK